MEKLKCKVKARYYIANDFILGVRYLLLFSIAAIMLIFQSCNIDPGPTPEEVAQEAEDKQKALNKNYVKFKVDCGGECNASAGSNIDKINYNKQIELNSRFLKKAVGDSIHLVFTAEVGTSEKFHFSKLTDGTISLTLPGQLKEWELPVSTTSNVIRDAKPGLDIIELRVSTVIDPKVFVPFLNGKPLATFALKAEFRLNLEYDLQNWWNMKVSRKIGIARASHELTLEVFTSEDEFSEATIIEASLAPKVAGKNTVLDPYILTVKANSNSDFRGISELKVKRKGYFVSLYEEDFLNPNRELSFQKEIYLNLRNTMDVGPGTKKLPVTFYVRKSEVLQVATAEKEFSIRYIPPPTFKLGLNNFDNTRIEASSRTISNNFGPDPDDFGKKIPRSCGNSVLNKNIYDVKATIVLEASARDILSKARSFSVSFKPNGDNTRYEIGSECDITGHEAFLFFPEGKEIFMNQSNSLVFAVQIPVVFRMIRIVKTGTRDSAAFWYDTKGVFSWEVRVALENEVGETTYNYMNIQLVLI